MSHPSKYTGCSSAPGRVVNGADSLRGAVGAALSTVHSTRSETPPGSAGSVTVAASRWVPAGRPSAPRSRRRLLCGFGSGEPLSDHATSRMRSVGWLVSTKTTSSPATGWLVIVEAVISAAGGDGATPGSPTVHSRVCTNRGPL